MKLKGVRGKISRSKRENRTYYLHAEIKGRKQEMRRKKLESPLKEDVELNHLDVRRSGRPPRNTSINQGFVPGRHEGREMPLLRPSYSSPGSSGIRTVHIGKSSHAIQTGTSSGGAFRLNEGEKSTTSFRRKRKGPFLTWKKKNRRGEESRFKEKESKGPSLSPPGKGAGGGGKCP